MDAPPYLLLLHYRPANGASVPDAPISGSTMAAQDGKSHAMIFPGSRQPVSSAERWFAALAYVGMGSLAAMLWGRGNFVLPHARLAFSLYLTRLLISGFGLGVWYFLAEGRSTLATIDLMRWVWHLLGLFVIGLPLSYMGGEGYLPWMLPVVAIWIADAIGMTIAIRGIALPWGLRNEPQRALFRPMREEKEQLRRLRERRLAQIADATTTAASERQRERVIRERKRDLGADLVRLDHLQHLLAMGELSETRYQQLRYEVVDDIGLLRDELDALGTRVSPHVAVQAVERPSVATLGSQLQARTLSLSFIDRSGLPLFTYGHFPLDEALIAGMLSAFNSLSQEVFGSPVNKTQLAEGQVLSFVHGDWCILMALFDAEPSPGQIARLQAALQAFERDNAAKLQRDPVQPSRLVLIGLDLGANVVDEVAVDAMPSTTTPSTPRVRPVPWTTPPPSEWQKRA